MAIGGSKLRRVAGLRLVGYGLIGIGFRVWGLGFGACGV